MGYEENDPAMIPEIQEMLDEFVKELEELRTKTLLSGEYDGCNAILKLNAGAGGTEAMDWCSMLYRMYQRWADKKGFTTEVLDFLDGDEAGLKSITLQVNGENAYGYLKSEKGVHRLVRISPFNAAGKRQTSFVSCDVMPDIEEDLDVEINPDDKGKAVPAQTTGECREVVRHPRRCQGHQLRKPDPFLRYAAVHARQGSPDERRKWQCERGDGWRY